MKVSSAPEGTCKGCSCCRADGGKERCLATDDGRAALAVEAAAAVETDILPFVYYKRMRR